MAGEEKWGKKGGKKDKKKKDMHGKRNKKKRKKVVTKLQAGKDKGAKDKANLSDIHLVGHSLGAHLMGYAGHHLRPLKVARITGETEKEYIWSNTLPSGSESQINKQAHLPVLTSTILFRGTGPRYHFELAPLHNAKVPGGLGCWSLCHRAALLRAGIRTHVQGSHA